MEARARAAPGPGLDLALAAAAVCMAGAIVANALSDARSGAPRDDIAAQARLRADPLDIEALRTLGLALDRRGQASKAEAVMSFVGRRTWRDGPTEVWLARRRLREGRFDEAFESIDSLLRRDGDGLDRPALFPTLIAAAAFAEARPALERRLAAAPWWRTDFLQALAVKADPRDARRVFEGLAAGANPPKPNEYAPLVDRLVREGDIAGGFAAWTEAARPADAAPGGIRDGDFSRAPDGSAFGWRIDSGVGATSAVAPSPDGSPGHALRVDYDGFASPRLPAQLLTLAAGRHRLAWRDRHAPTDTGALVWRIRCVGADGPLAQVTTTGDPSRWRRRFMDFDVPPTHCPGQWLELTAAPGERRNPVTAWYETFRLER